MKDTRGSSSGPSLTRRAALALLAAPAGAALAAAALAQEDATLGPAPSPTTPPVVPDASPYPTFRPEPSVTATVRCVGSSSVGLMLNALRNDFREAQPGVSLEIVSSGSGTAPKLLADGTSDLAPMSRAMRPDEIALVEKARGCEVRGIDVAIDAIAISVNRQNPLERISLRDLDRIYGRERRRGGGPVAGWPDLGVRVAGARSQEVVAYGLGENTGSYGIIREVVLLGGTYRTNVNEEPVSSSVIQAIAADPLAIGYASAFFDAVRTRRLAVESLSGGEFLLPTEANVRSGRYPLSRALRIYFVVDPKRPNPGALQLLRYLVSEDGQEILGALGQLTLAPEQAHEMTRRIP